MRRAYKPNKLYTKRFLTRDTKGCEFWCMAYYVRQVCELVETTYVAEGLGVQADTLDKLKAKVSAI